MEILIKTERYVKKAGTKTVFILTEQKEEIIREEEYNNIIESIPFFKRLGGSEYAIKSYTKYGYKTVQLTSKNPDKQNKTIRYFEFL